LINKQTHNTKRKKRSSRFSIFETRHQKQEQEVDTMSSTNYIPDTGGHVPEDKDQKLVQTPYGDGITIRTRNRYYDNIRKSSSSNNTATSSNDKHVVKMYEIELQSWEKIPIPVSSAQTKGGNHMIRHKPTMLYTSIHYPSVKPVVGNEVICVYGRGKLIEIRSGSSSGIEEESSSLNDIYVVKLTSWRLTERSTITCYLNKDSIHVLRPKKIYEMNVYERIERGIELKAIATELFRKKLYESALSSYALAVDAVRYIQHQPHTPNSLRADLLMIMITCHNNAATCCTQLKLWSETKKHSKNAEILVDALKEKAITPINGASTLISSQPQQYTSKIHAILNHDGFSDIKLFGEYKTKSMLLYSTALFELGELEIAIETIKKAIELVEQYIRQIKDNQSSASFSLKQLELNQKELHKLLRSCKEKKKKQLEKEKLRAQAMFGGNNNSKSSSSSTKVTTATTNNKHEKVNGSHYDQLGSSNSNSTNNVNGAKNGQHQLKHSTKQQPISANESTSVQGSSEVSERGLKKKVTFSENIESHNITDLDDENGKSTQSISSTSRKHSKKNADDDDWDYESIVGLGLLVGGAVLGVAVTYFISQGYQGRK
jgi:tetratricopeptide (TPR) repeat protein